MSEPDFPYPKKDKTIKGAPPPSHPSPDLPPGHPPNTPPVKTNATTKRSNENNSKTQVGES